MNVARSTPKKNPHLNGWQAVRVQTTGAIVMQIIIPENINLFTCDDGIKFSPIIDGVISDCYLIPWEEVLDIACRILILKKYKDEIESGKSPF